MGGAARATSALVNRSLSISALMERDGASRAKPSCMHHYNVCTMGGPDLVVEARRIGEEVAGRCADEVDRDARFPAETVAEFRSSGLLGAMVPKAQGGRGVSVAEMSAAVVTISEYCASSGLVLAMHQIQVAGLARHGTTAAIDDVLERVATGSLLLANANSEVGLGGERRSSICALEPKGDGFRLDKQASTVSYGEYADGILATARRTPDSLPHDQVLVVCLEPALSVNPTGDWDTLGLRGTCSRPCQVIADVPADLIISDYATVFARTSLPVSGVLAELGVDGNRRIRRPPRPHVGAGASAQESQRFLAVDVDDRTVAPGRAGSAAAPTARGARRGSCANTSVARTPRTSRS